MISRKILNPTLTPTCKRCNFVKTLKERPFLNRPTLTLFSLFLLLHCANPEQPLHSKLTDDRFADLFIEVYHLNQRENPNSLSAQKQKIYRHYEVTAQDLQSFINTKQTPESWQPVLLRIREKLGEEIEVKPGSWDQIKKQASGIK